MLRSSLPTLTLSLCLVACGGDGGTADSGLGDAGTVPSDDAGTIDAGSGSTDAGAADAGTADAGSTASDAGPADDAALPDGGSEVRSRSYLVRRDFRRCPAPLCGGWWVQEINAETTRCFDGSTEAECYVVELDWGASGYSSEEQDRALEAEGGMILDGQIRSGSYGGMTLDGLKIEAAWFAGWGVPEAVPSTAAFHALIRTPLSCIVDPCFNINVDELNTATRSMASGLDLMGTGADTDEQSRGMAGLTSGDLRATGQIQTDSEPGPGGLGETYIATQFYLPL